MGLEIIKDLVFRDNVRNVQKNLWILFLYVITSLPVSIVAYVQIHLQIMKASSSIGVRFATSYSVFFIIMGIVLMGFIYLYFNFLKHVNEALKTIGLEVKKMHRQFLAIGILLVLVNILGGLFMLFNAYDLGTYIGRVADPLDIKSSIIRIPSLYTKHIFFGAYYSINVALLFIFSIYTAMTLIILWKTIRMRLMQIIGWLIFVDAILFIIYMFIFTRSSLLIIMLAIIAISIVLLGSIAFTLPRRLLELYRVYRRE